MGAVARQPTSLGPDAFVAAAERFAVATAWSDMRAPVPSCPGWSTYDLVVHLANVHAWAATIVETGRVAPEQHDVPPSSRAKAVSEWYAAKAEDLYQVLRQVPPDRPCWNFAFGAGVAGFWPRRQLHETTVHGIDLDLACGRPVTVARDVASDGVSEVLGVMLPRMHRRAHPAVLDRPLAITSTDTRETWVVEPQQGAPSVRVRSSVPSEVTDRVRAPADVLYRTLWHRPVEGAALQILGDEGRVRAFLGSRLTP